MLRFTGALLPLVYVRQTILKVILWHVLQAANELLNIIGIRAAFVLTEYQGKIYISARSIDEINVQRIMERLGGGGHLNTAGAQLTDCSIEEACKTIQNTLDEMIEEGDIK